MGWEMEGGDDEALHTGIKKCPQTQLRHTRAQDLVIGAIALAPRAHPSLSRELPQGLIKGQYRMGRWRVAELSVAVEPAELVQQIQAQAAYISVASLEQRAPAKNEAKSGHAFQTLVRRRDQEIDAASLEVDWNSAETAHRIHNELLACGAR